MRWLGVLVLLTLVACGRAPAEDAATTTPVTSAPPTTQAPVPPRPDPKPGECHALTYAAATKSVDPKRPVPCRGKHTSVTYAVGQLDVLHDGHLLAVDSLQAHRSLDSACERGLGRWLGGDNDALRLSRFRSVWFRTDLDQAERGANWYRCDVVAVAGDNRLAQVPGDLRGVLNDPRALDTFGICGTSSPAAKGHRRVICSERHSWRAVSVVDLPRGAKYLGKAPGAEADTRCQDVATARTNPSLKYEWAFQWPTREQWRSGQRYGWCWLPA